MRFTFKIILQKIMAPILGAFSKAFALREVNSVFRGIQLRFIALKKSWKVSPKLGLFF